MKNDDFIHAYSCGKKGTNTHLRILKMNNCSLHAKTLGFGLRTALATNRSLTQLELDTNPIDLECVENLLMGLSQDSALQTLKLTNSGKLAAGSSGAAEKLVLERLEEGGVSSLIELGMDLRNAHYRERINRKLMANRDLLRVKRNNLSKQDAVL